MIATEVQVVKVNTMADGTPRITIDLLNGTSEEFKTAFELMAQDTRMYLGTVEEFDNELKTKTYE